MIEQMLLWSSTILAAISFIWVAGCAIHDNSINRRRVREINANIKDEYKTAVAGSPSGYVPLSDISVSQNFTEFRNSNGELLIPNDYYKFVVWGNSMSFCGIKDKDLIFVRKNFKLSQMSNFPVPIVIHRIEKDETQTQYKVRRAWRICNINDWKENIDSIFDSPTFNERIKCIKYYDNDENLQYDFENVRLKKYIDDYINCPNADEKNTKVVISTTYRTDVNKIRFSIHPVSSIIGIVSESFTPIN